MIISVGATVQVINLGNPCGAQWLVQSDAVINNGATIPGNILALGLEGGSVHLLQLKDASAYAGSIPAGRSGEWAAIAPNVLRYGVLEPLWAITDDDLRAGVVEYSHDAGEVLAFVRSHAAGAAFMLNPVGIESVMSLADQGERMPQKSTFFHPKLGTGLVFHPLEP